MAKKHSFYEFYQKVVRENSTLQPQAGSGAAPPAQAGAAPAPTGQPTGQGVAPPVPPDQGVQQQIMQQIAAIQQKMSGLQDERVKGELGKALQMVQGVFGQQKPGSQPQQPKPAQAPPGGAAPQPGAPQPQPGAPKPPGQ